jgi:beta-galactosidase
MTHHGITRRALIQSSALVAVSTACGTPTLADNSEVEMGSVFPAGAVYFRKSNPPPAEWARDYRAAAAAGMNTFRHWFMWSSIEVAPGKYDWTDYDRQMDLAAENGIKVIIGVFDDAAPEWAFRKYAHARYLGGDGVAVDSGISGSSATGGFPGLCLDNADVKAACEHFLVALIEHYRGHPALLGYDLFNETGYRTGAPPHMYCFCNATKASFRGWLKKRYGTLEAVARTWGRYSYAYWADVQPPHNFAGYAESLDWLSYRIDIAYELFDWRVALVRKLDPKHLVTGHGTGATLVSHGTGANDEWRAAARVDVYGHTWVASRNGADAWRQYQAVDITRAGARGKPFWHAEATGGPLWLQPQLKGHPKEDGRQTTAEDVRLWFMVECAAGARGQLYTRWRGLLDDILFGAFGLYGMDGSATPQSDMASKTFRWANANPKLWQSRPVRGEVGLVFVPESELFNVVQQGDSDYYAQSVRGAYQAFFDSNIQPDFVALDDIGGYRLIYLAYPVHMSAETVVKLKRYVQGGGTLVCEGLPAYFGDHGHVGETQPNYGLNQLFGCRQESVEFYPDIADEMTLEVEGTKIFGRYFRQTYGTAGGKAIGHFDDGKVAAVENQSGAGRTVLIGTFPGAGYYLHHKEETRRLFARLLARAGVAQMVKSDNTAVQARLHTGAGRTYVWVTNSSGATQSVRLTLDAVFGSFSGGEDVWGGRAVAVNGREMSFSVSAKDAVVIALR